MNASGPQSPGIRPKAARRGLACASILAFGCAGGGGGGAVPPPAGTSPGDASSPAFPYLDPDLPVAERVEDLLSRMTLDEKISQTVYSSPGIERLGIPAYNWWNEALHGVARAGPATVFPQAIGLAASWDDDLIRRVATAIADEARAKHHQAIREGRRGIYEGLTFWSPNINLFRDPRWGRGMETYGEDPYLTGRLAVEFVRGLQGDDRHYLKTVATPKHFAVHSGPEADRHTFDAVVSERDLRETYLPAFRAAVVEGGAESVMCAYNRVLGVPACASHELLRRTLRDEWNFGGYVVSDCWAIADIYQTHRLVATAPEAAAMALAAGTDLNCGVTYDSLAAAIDGGLATEDQVDVAVRRLLTARFRLGMFDPPDRVPFAGISTDVVGSTEHRELALEAARKSIVLLKNDAGLLPLDRSLARIAVIGPNADDPSVLLGNYNGIPIDPVTPLRGIRGKVSPSTRVEHAVGSEIAPGLSLVRVPGSALRPSGDRAGDPDGAVGNGLRAEFFSSSDLEGDPVYTRMDEVVDEAWWGEAPIPGLEPGRFGVRWTGILVPPVSGRYTIGTRTLGRSRMFLGDSLVLESANADEQGVGRAEVELRADEPVELRLDFAPERAHAAVELVWRPPLKASVLRAEAVRAAADADAAVMFMGLSPRLEGEQMTVEVEGFSGGDRLDLGLPPEQETLLREVAATGTPVVLVLLNGSALALPWAAEHVPSIVEAWYPGEAAGTAIADVLFGDYNPAGRLPVTFYRSTDQLPAFDDYRMDGRTYRYFDGEPLFRFGHGLSYTTFEYRDLEIPAAIGAGDPLEISVEVRNTGARAGEEVVQLYVEDVESSVPAPIRSLAGFRRVRLDPGESATVRFTLEPRQMSLVADDGTRVLEPGTFRISVGGGQPGAARSSVESPGGNGVTETFEVTGDPVRLDP